MDFHDYWEYTRARLDEELHDWVPRFFCELPERQLATIHDILKGGKRLRGCLVCLVNDALGGAIENAIPRAVAVECIQAASLIHDDYVDGDRVRRNRPAQWTIEGARKAVLLGDVVFATAIQRMAEISRGDGIAAAEAIATMAQGAYREFPEPGVPDAHHDVRNDYDLIIYLKTGALFGAAAKLGALSAGAPPALRGLAFRFGACLGEAYQIADDLQDVMDGVDLNPMAQAAAPAPLFQRFAGNTSPQEISLGAERNGALRSQPEALRPAVRERMIEAIRTRVAQAQGEAAKFPGNHYSPLLRAAPEEIVRMMQAADL